MTKDFRENYILHKGDTLVCGELTYTIDGEPLGYGGSAVLYPARCSNSDSVFAIKEFFPCREGQFIRENGVVTPVGEAHFDKETVWKQFDEERQNGQLIGNQSFRGIKIFENMQADTITTDGHTHDATMGVFALLENMEGKGCMLKDILAECRKTPDEQYPLRNNGLPHIHTTALIMKQLLRALQEIHESGYLYGDVQPGNLFFASCRLSEAELGYGCFFDFGCSRKLLNNGKTDVISDKKIFSTEGYIPPEIRTQNDGTLQLSKAADIYSAGRLMLLCLLTDGKDLEKNCFSRKKMLLGADAEKIGCSDETIIFVNEILYKALHTKPEERYQDAAEMLEDIQKLEKRTSPPLYKLASNLSAPDYFVEGNRAEIIAAAKKSLMETKHRPVFLWGYGGIGKTETAIRLASEWKSDKGAFLIPYKGTMRDTILSLPFTGYEYRPSPKLSEAENTQKQYEGKLRILTEQYTGALFIIDNFDQSGKTFADLRAEQAYRDITGLDIRLVFTTRNVVENINGGLEITALDTEDLLKLMKQILIHVSVSEESLLALIDAVEGHTLMVTLIAKTLEERRGRLSSQELLEAFQNAKMSEADLPKVSTNQNRANTQAQIYQHMRVLFDVASLSEEEKSVLIYATLLPHAGMNAELFQSCVEAEKQDVLIDLDKKGWLRWSADGMLTIHPVIREIVREELKPTDEKCTEFLKRLDDQTHTTSYNYDLFCQMVECFEITVKSLDDKNNSYLESTAYCYYRIGQLDKALEYYLQCLTNRNENSEEIPTSLITKNLDILGSLYEKLGDYRTALEYILKELSLLKKEEPDTLPEVVNCYLHMGGIYMKLGDDKQAEIIYLLAFNLLRNTNIYMPIQFVKCITGLGSIQLEHGENEKAYNIFNDAKNYLTRIGQDDSLDMGNIYDYIGIILCEMGEFTKAIEHHEKAEKIYCKFAPEDSIELGNLYANKGNAYGYMGDYKNARKYLQKAIKLQKRGCITNPNLAKSYHSLGNFYMLEKQDKLALYYFNETKKIFENFYAPNRIEMAELYNSLANTYMNLKNYEIGKEYIEHAIEICKNASKKDSVGLAYYYLSMGRYYAENNELETALTFYQNARKIFKDNLPISHPTRKVNASNIGTIYKKLGNYALALQYFKEANGETDSNVLFYEVEETPAPYKSPATSLPQQAINCTKEGDILFDAENYIEALEKYKKAKELREEEFGTNHPVIVASYKKMATVYETLNLWTDFLACYVRISEIQLENFGENHSKLPDTYSNMAKAYAKLGDKTKTKEYKKKTWEARFAKFLHKDETSTEE